MVLQEQSAPGKLLPSQNASWSPVVSISAGQSQHIIHQKNCVRCSLINLKIPNTLLSIGLKTFKGFLGSTMNN